ncbi:hypothetical protein HYU10_02955 [Candidatus Woesearchaeota archaeon]|nr:hypothetical protein [Candidatus Woesearchaeota archaeon]
MHLWVHFVTSTALAALLYPNYGWIAALVFIGGFLIDFDHYMWYILKTKDFSIRKCYDFYVIPSKEKDYFRHKGALLAFHTIEALLVLAALAFYSKIFLMVLYGMLLHWALDLIFRMTKPKMVFLTQPSVIFYFVRKK